MKKFIGLFFFLSLQCLTSHIHAQAPNILWQKSLGGTLGDYLEVIKPTADGGYIAAGYSSSAYTGDKTAGFNGIYDCWIIRLDANGNKIWDKTYGGSNFDGVYEIIEAKDGSFWVTAQSNSPDDFDKTEVCRGGMDYWVLHIADNGNLLWQKTLGSNKHDYLQSAIPTSDGGILLSGSTMEYYVSVDKKDTGCYFNSLVPYPNEVNDTSKTSDIWVIKIEADGNVSWQKSLGGHNNESIGKMVESNHGTYVIAATTSSNTSYFRYPNCERFDPFWGYSDYWLVEIDNHGVLVEESNFGGYDEDKLEYMSKTSDGGYILVGSSNSQASGNKAEAPYYNYDYWIVKVDSNLNKQWDRVYGSNQIENGKCIIQTKDGGYLVGGSSEGGLNGNKTVPAYGLKDYWLLKLDANGIDQWQYSIGGNSMDRFSYLGETQDEKIIVGGTSFTNISGLKNTPSKGDCDFWVLLLDKNPAQTTNTISQLLSDQLASVYPIPSNQYVHIDFIKPTQKAMVVIYDMLGNRVKSTSLSDTKNMLDVSFLNQGNYILTIQVEGKLQSRKFTIIK